MYSLLKVRNVVARARAQLALAYSLVATLISGSSYPGIGIIVYRVEKRTT